MQDSKQQIEPLATVRSAVVIATAVLAATVFFIGVLELLTRTILFPEWQHLLPRTVGANPYFGEFTLPNLNIRRINSGNYDVINSTNHFGFRDREAGFEEDLSGLLEEEVSEEAVTDLHVTLETEEEPEDLGEELPEVEPAAPVEDLEGLVFVDQEPPREEAGGPVSVPIAERMPPISEERMEEITRRLMRDPNAKFGETKGTTQHQLCREAYRMVDQGTPIRNFEWIYGAAAYLCGYNI